jgi:hypothetical protein
MTSHKLRLLVSGICFLLFTKSAVAQKLSLEEVLTAYTLDSIALNQFCTQKNFVLTKVKEDKWIFSYTYHAIPDKKISFIKTFPKDSTARTYLYYYFEEKKDYKSFKDALKAKGFRNAGGYETLPGTQYSDYRERYTTAQFQIELASPDMGDTKRVLLLHKK